jgi:hypothetical protein
VWFTRLWEIATKQIDQFQAFSYPTVLFGSTSNGKESTHWPWVGARNPWETAP